jgi:hypothetical protein
MVRPFMENKARFSTGNWSRIAVAAMFGWTTTIHPVFAQNSPFPDPGQQAQPAPGQAAPGQTAPAPVYTLTDLEYSLGPIALYPDALLALILPASTFPLQLVQAERWLARNEQAVERGDFTKG